MSQSLNKTHASTSPPGLFVTGTDTEVGKTYVAARIAQAIRRDSPKVSVAVYKPVASGCCQSEDDERLVSDDAVELWEAADRPRTLDEVCPQRFAAAVAPPVAANQVGQSVDESQLVDGLDVWRDSDFVVVEGVGGFLSPLSETITNADLAALFQFPLIVVAGNRLGVINHTLLTIEAARGRGLTVAGVVLCDVQAKHDTGENVAACDESRDSNFAQLQKHCLRDYDVTVLAHLKHGADRFEPPLDWTLIGQ